MEMVSLSLPSNNLDDIFQIYRRYCEITLEVYASEGAGCRQANELAKAKLAREALSQLLELVESRVYKSMSILEEVSLLMSRLNLLDSREFSRFYNFVFFMCRENGQKSIAVSRAILAWKLVLSGRFRLLNQWCSFVENNQRHNISEDTWSQVLTFSCRVQENLEGYDPKGAWPVLIDDFVDHMYSITGSEGSNNVCSSSSDLNSQPVYESLPGKKLLVTRTINYNQEIRKVPDCLSFVILAGLKAFPGSKRKFDEDMQGEECEAMDAFMDSNTKRRYADSTDKQLNGVEHQQIINMPLGCSKPPYAVEGCLSKGFAELLFGRP
uniref:defective in cullin neddylation protein AAR3-like isoform X1 n=1 Tax=Erigeron canadensis TaxID=72917 RepID=UPI001CB8E68D|nr:defective in cullin neddylation protein AAR3-like isoform X1 [Erigeron canadensis]